MLTFELDLNTKIISGSTQVYMARAGQGGHLFEEVRRLNAIGPDLPNLNLNLERGIHNEEHLKEKIERAREFRKWLQLPEDKKGLIPPQDLNHYVGKPVLRGHKRIVNIVKQYFDGLQENDLVIIPNPYVFNNVIIAEILPLSSENIVKLQGKNKFEGRYFDGRRFRNTKSVKISDLPRSIINIIRQPTALERIEDENVKNSIFALKYDNFAKEDLSVSRILTLKEDFDSFDNNVLSTLATMVANNVQQLDSGEKEETLKLFNLVESAFKQLESEEFRIKIDIHSPGFFAAYDKTITPLVMTAFFAVLTAANFDARAFEQEFTVESFNSQGESSTEEYRTLTDFCNQQVMRKTEIMLRIMSAQAQLDFRDTCNLLQQLHENTGATTKMSVEIENGD